MSNVPARMTAIVIRAPGGPEMLVPEERPVPQPGPAEVLVKVAAAGVNRPDVMQRMGQYPPPKGATDIPGLELAGEVGVVGGREVGPAVLRPNGTVFATGGTSNTAIYNTASGTWSVGPTFAT